MAKTSEYYKKNPKAAAKRAYRRELMKIRRKRKPGKQTDMSHRGGKIVAESRKTNRGRGGSKKR